jgi:hypothetical protein
VLKLESSRRARIARLRLSSVASHDAANFVNRCAKASPDAFDRGLHWRVPCGDLATPNGTFTQRAQEAWQNAYYALRDRCDLILNEDVNLYATYWRSLEASRTDAEKLEMLGLSQNYENRMKDMRDMVPFLTHEKHVGMAPMAARVDDVVVVFPGGDVPFVLREHAGSGQYTLLGPCYCHGIMDGEILAEGRELCDIFLV